jgi:transposase-like protein
MIKVIPKEIKDEVLSKVKDGQKVVALALQYGISDKTIYRWLSKCVVPEVRYSEYSRLKRENDELKRIIGIISLDLEL